MSSTTKVQQLQILQQNIQTILAQKQQFQNNISDIDGALSELKKTDKAYLIIGKVMLGKPKEELATELEQRKEVLNLRLKNFNAQEEKLQQMLETTQKEALEELKKKKK